MSQGRSMSQGRHLQVQPSMLAFEFELGKQSSCSFQLTNETDQKVGFKVKTTTPQKYTVKPNLGTLHPLSRCDVIVTMGAQLEPPTESNRKDKFLVQSIILNDSKMTKDIIVEMFRNAPELVVEECKLDVSYILANPPTPVKDESEGETLSQSSAVHNQSTSPSKSDTEAATLAKLKEELRRAYQEIEKLKQQLREGGRGAL